MTIPNKLYFSISEVAEMTGVKPHVLRYWESEFQELRPKKNRAGNRSYREKDIRMVMTIRDLLYQKGFTIQGARLQLKERPRHEEPAARLATPEPEADKADQLLRLMRRELQELRKRLD
ncbi:MAG: MerR family transcriptional regulator [Candidatus Krumholzibacteriia bacterium]